MMQTIKKNQLFKCIHILTLAVFLLSTVSENGTLCAQTLRAGNVFSPEISQVSLPAFSIPSELGEIREYHRGADAPGSRPFILHVQDVHADPEAQLKVRDLLHYLSGEMKTKPGEGPELFIALEGASGELHPEYLEFFPDFPQ